MERIDTIIARWMARSEECRRFRAQVDGETMCGEIIADLRELASGGSEHDLLNLREAAETSGYNEDTLGRMIRDGRLTNHGRQGAPRVKRGDLPKKAPALTGESAVVSLSSRRQVVRAVVHSKRKGA